MRTGARIEGLGSSEGVGSSVSSTDFVEQEPKYLDPTQVKFPLSALRARPRPPGCDPTRLEVFPEYVLSLVTTFSHQASIALSYGRRL